MLLLIGQLEKKMTKDKFKAKIEKNGYGVMMALEKAIEKITFRY